MAEAANYLLTSESKPSIFEIIAQNSLNVTLQPALQKIAQFLGNASPNYLYWLNNYYDESFMVLNGYLQYHYLKNHGASFAEHFYGLKRVRMDDYELTKCQQHLSWLYLVIFPYVKTKIEEKINVYRLEQADSLLRNDLNGRLKKGLILAHSAYEISWGSWILVNYLRYMSDKTEIQLPHLKLLNIKLIYSNVEDNFIGFWTALFKRELSFSELSGGLLQNGVRSVLEISAFFVQFLQAWNAEKANFNVTALPPIKPPELDTKAQQYKEKCPICLQFWRIPTVLPVSGYVFCFSCILKHLRENEKCPVTHLPAKPLDIIRLYDSE